MRILGLEKKSRSKWDIKKLKGKMGLTRSLKGFVQLISCFEKLTIFVFLLGLVIKNSFSYKNEYYIV